MNQLYSDLIGAVTRYDRSQQNRKDYNIWALARYIDAAGTVANSVESGDSLANALKGRLNGRLLASVQKQLKAKGYTGVENV